MLVRHRRAEDAPVLAHARRGRPAAARERDRAVGVGARRGGEVVRPQRRAERHPRVGVRAIPRSSGRRARTADLATARHGAPVGARRPWRRRRAATAWRHRRSPGRASVTDERGGERGGGGGAPRQPRARRVGNPHPAGPAGGRRGVNKGCPEASPLPQGMPMGRCMDAPPPITLAIARFSDLLGLGLRAALADDPSVAVVATDIEYSRLGVVLQAHQPDVLILDVDEVVDLAMVRELSVEHPETHLVLLGDGLSILEGSQLLALGAGACLDKRTQARDVRNAIHLVSRGLQLMPRGPAHARPRRADAARGRGAPPPARGPLERADRARARHRGRDGAEPRAQRLPQARRPLAAGAGRGPLISRRRSARTGSRPTRAARAG